MLYIALLLSLIFLAVGFIVTEKNAKYILSGYNTMSEAKRATVDIVGYLGLFKRFHITLAISLLAGTVLISLINNNWASVFMTVYPLLAYLYLILRANQYFSDKGQRLTSYVVAGLLLAVATAVAISQFSSLGSNTLILKDNVLEIQGAYGMTLSREEIKGLDMQTEVPAIAYKSNGFAAGDYAKGNFKLKGGKKAKLFINKTVSPVLLLKTSKGDIYYNADDADMIRLYKEITAWWRL